MAESKSLVKNSSKAYGYNYASLADIVKQGFEIPKMRIAVHEGNDYIEYWDGKEWQLGARVVVPDMRGSNEAQRYGAAITYARRMTCMMCLSLAGTDDEKIETADKESYEYNSKPKFDLKKADLEIRLAQTPDEVRRIYAEAPEKLQQYLRKGCEARIKELEA